MKTGSYQQGFISLKVFLLLLVVGFFATFGFSVVPAYIDNSFVVAALKKIGDDEPPLHTLSIGEVKKELYQAFRLNNIRTLPPNSVKVSRDKDRVFIDINYETRKNLFYNIDLVLTFENHLDSMRPDKCCKPLPNTKTKKADK